MRGLALGSIAALAFASIGSAGAGAQPVLDPLQRGHEAWMRHDLSGAERAWRSAAGSGDARVRAEAERRLASIAWRVRADTAAASRHLEAALRAHDDIAPTLLERARMHLAASRHASALRDARAAFESAADDDLRADAARLGAMAIADADAAARLDAAWAIEFLRGRLPEQHGRTSDAYPLLLASLATGHLETAHDALRSYLHIGAPPLDAASPSVDARSLASRRLYEAAAIAGGASRDVIAYARFIRDVRRDVDDAYRRTLLRAAPASEVQRVYTRRLRALWPALSWPGAPPPFAPALAEAELSRRFGAVVSLGRTEPFGDLHFGHVVASSVREVALGIDTLRVHHLVVDGMVSNGFQGWAWDEPGAIAGWSMGDTVVEVRTAATENPFRLWRAVTDTGGGTERRARFARLDDEDLRRAARDSITYFPGAADRLRDAALRTVLDSLRREGVADDSLKGRFIAALDAARRGAVLAHEDRHVLELRRRPRSGVAAHEYRAKLSEIAATSLPRLAVAGMIHPNVGDATPHGAANRLMLLGLHRWMRANAGAIAGLDPRRPLLMQLQLLTDAQIRAAVSSLDASPTPAPSRASPPAPR